MMQRLSSLASLLALLAPTALAAQIFPTPSPETPRIQSVDWRGGENIVLTALPQTSLTVMLEPGEIIQRATLGGNSAWSVAVSAESDSFQVTPQAGATPARLTVQTDARLYEFTLEMGQGLQAAYLVRLSYGQDISIAQPAIRSDEPITQLDWSYRLRGDKSVLPISVRDNGVKTVIEYAPGQALPAVFAIGPTGDEEVVDGYMRGDLFVIDRVHQRLVFRIDKEKARARRNKDRDSER